MPTRTPSCNSEGKPRRLNIIFAANARTRQFDCHGKRSLARRMARRTARTAALFSSSKAKLEQSAPASGRPINRSSQRNGRSRISRAAPRLKAASARSLCSARDSTRNLASRFTVHRHKLSERRFSQLEDLMLAADTYQEKAAVTRVDGWQGLGRDEIYWICCLDALLSMQPCRS